MIITLVLLSIWYIGHSAIYVFTNNYNPMDFNTYLAKAHKLQLSKNKTNPNLNDLT